MDIEKAKQASGLLDKRDFIKRILDEATTIWAINPIGTTTITIPRTWLPAIVKIAEEELVKVEEEIARL